MTTTLADQARDFAVFAGISEEDARAAILDGLMADRIDAVADILVRIANGVEQVMDRCIISVKQWRVSTFDWTANSLTRDASKREQRGRYDPPPQFRFVRAEGVRLMNTDYAFEALRTCLEADLGRLTTSLHQATVEESHVPAPKAWRTPIGTKPPGPLPATKSRVEAIFQQNPGLIWAKGVEAEAAMKAAGVAAGRTVITDVQRELRKAHPELRTTPDSGK